MMPNKFLKSCSDRYAVLCEIAAEFEHTASDELLLEWVQMSANFAAMNHPGLFADGNLENLALKTGRSLHCLENATPRANEEPTDQQNKDQNAYQKAAEYNGQHRAKTPRTKESPRRVLHVATTIASIGGHTRTIINWILNDTRSEHSLLTTGSAGVAIPTELKHAIESSGGTVIVQSSDTPLCTRAQQLNVWATRNADMVFLHIVPHDVVPVAAFAKAGGPPVGLINLADQCFWLGSTIADSVVHLREIGASTSKQIRSTRNDLLLPIPLYQPENILSPNQARTQLSIPDSQIMLVSVGRSIKYAPTESHNFFQAACRILNEVPEAHVYVVGVSDTDFADRQDVFQHPRLHLVGAKSDATVYQMAADVYIEGFPFGSQTALLEAALFGKACVPAIAHKTALLATQDFSLNDLVETPINEDAYVDRVLALIRDDDQRINLGQALRQSVLDFHIGESWTQRLESVYESLQKLSHDPASISAGSPQQRPVDEAISAYHSTRLDDNNIQQFVINESCNAILFSAYLIRRRGFHLDSLRLMRIAHRDRAWSARTLLDVLKLLPHKVVSLLKNAPV